MSAFDSLLERLREAQEAASQVRMVAESIPSDPYVLANLESIEQFADDLETSWNESCIEQSVEVCRYRLVRDASSRFSVSTFTRSLLDFQELFSQIFDACKNGPKQRAIVTPEVRAKTEFEFGFSFPGSLGVTLFAPSERNLFGNDFDLAVDTFFETIGIEDEFQVRDMAKLLGKAVVKRLYDWSLVNSNSGLDIDITWNTGDGIRKGQYVTRAQQNNLVNIIGQAADIEVEAFKAVGTLVGIDVQAERFRFVVRGGADIAGSLADTLSRQIQWSVNTNYIAEFEAETRTNLATLDVSKTYRLKALDPEFAA